MKDPFSEFLPYSGKANFEGVNPQFMDNFQQMANEYMTQTGKQLTVNDAFRTRETQAKAYKEKPNLAAPPGHSWHERGMAMDIDETQANELDKLGLLGKYGFERPMMTKAPGKKYEPWHIQWAPFEAKASKVAATADPFAEFVTPAQKTGGTQENPFAEMAQPQPERQPSAMGGFKEGPATTPPQVEGVAPEDFTRAPAPGEVEALKQRVLNPPNMGYRPEIVRPLLNATGLIGGEAAGLASAPVTGPVGPIAGPTLGYALSEKIASALESHMGQKPTPGLVESITQSLEDVYTGAKITAEGLAGGKVLQGGLGLAGKAARAGMGRLSGVGTGAIEEAQKGGFNFIKAMRGKISGEEIVETAKDALQSLKNKRAAAYQGKLAEISQAVDPVTQQPKQIDVTDINTTLRDMMKKWGVKVTTEGEIDTTGAAVGAQGERDLKSMIERVWTWTDNSPLGIDALKRKIGDFYSESKQARAFAAELKKTVTNTLEKQVPEYAEMTKPYAEATSIIKDIEKGLSLRKSGMDGRVTADQSLRRLTSAMRDNFELRRDLVNTLGAGSGEDIAGLIAGYSMSSGLPRGLAGTFMIPEAMFAWFVNPKVWPMLAASSPRLQGEFLNLVGKGIRETTGVSVPLARSFAYIAETHKRRDREPKTYRPGDPEIYGIKD